MIGIKTVAAVVLAALAVGGAGLTGLLDPDYLHGLSAAGAMIVGLFASLATALLAIGWNPGEPSRRGLGRGERVREAPAAVQVALLAVVMLVVGLSAFGNREAQLITTLPARLEVSAADYCPEEAEPEPEAEPVKKVPAATARGCALIQRAYDLGYSDDLGDCAPVELEVADAETIERTVCRLRQRGEPFLHYTWRLLDQRMESADDLDPVGRVSGGIDEMQTRLGYAGTLLAQQAHAIRSTPRASHHLFVNLPAPRDRSWLDAFLGGDDCRDRYESLPTRTRWDDAAPAALVEHAAAQLLFNPAFGPTAGTCTEYTIHWDAPADACDRLVDDPDGFLDDRDALDPAVGVLDRRRRQLELRALSDALGEKPVVPDPPPARGLVSFQCYIADPAGTGEVSERTVRLAGELLEVRELRTAAIEPAGAGQLRVYQQLATLLGGGRYSGPAESTSALQVAARPPSPDDLDAPGLALARLEVLREADPFLGSAWPLDRPALADVYPMHYHLATFAEVFRRQYRGRRGRL